MLALQHGLVLHAGRPFYPADIVAELAAAPRPRVLVTTPVHLQVLLAEPATMPPVDLLLSATAPLSVQLAREAEAAVRRDAVRNLRLLRGGTDRGSTHRARRRSGAASTVSCCVRIRAGTWASGTPIADETLLSDVHRAAR